MLSVIYTTFNEIDIIGRSLDSLGGLGEEVIVVDSFSTDGTAELLRARPEVTLYQREYRGPSDQKNWAIGQAANEWILLLDADEIVTDELRSEISLHLRAVGRQVPASIRGARPDKDAYWIHRNNFFMGRRIYHSGWAGERVVRFFHRDRARYNSKQVHEEIVLDGLTVGTLTGRLDHHLFKNLAHFQAKNERYARWSARDKEARTGRIGAYHLLVKPVWRFLKHYVVQGGFRDGKEGLILSMIIGYSVFQRYAFMLEERRNRKVSHN